MGRGGREGGSELCISLQARKCQIFEEKFLKNVHEIFCVISTPANGWKSCVISSNLFNSVYMKILFSPLITNIKRKHLIDWQFDLTPPPRWQGWSCWQWGCGGNSCWAPTCCWSPTARPRHHTHSPAPELLLCCSGCSAALPPAGGSPGCWNWWEL